MVKSLTFINFIFSGGSKSKPLYSICCAQGKVRLPALDPLPNRMSKLLNDSDFLTNDRKYNAAFSLISFKAASDKNLSSNSVYTLRIAGQIFHRIGPRSRS